MKCPEQANLQRQKVDWVAQTGAGFREMESDCSWEWGFFLKLNILKLDYVDSCTICKYNKNYRTVQLMRGLYGIKFYL